MNMPKNAVFLGSKSLGLSIFKTLYQCSPMLKWTLIYPEDDKDSRSNFHEFQQFAQLHDINFIQVTSATLAKEALMKLIPDIGFVCGWYWLFDRETLTFVPFGFWGVHNSLLPKYRGGSPLVWSIINGEQIVGSSVFQISEGMDSGKILYQVQVENTDQDDINSLLKKIGDNLQKYLPEKWRELITGTASLSEQDEDYATYCGQRIEDDGLVDWNKPAREIHNFIKAQTKPYPCAFSYFFGKKIYFLKSQICDEKYFGTPGQVLRREQNSIIISCGENSALEIMKIIVEEKEEIPAKILHSIKHRLSTR